MHFLGLAGMPRRISDYPDSYLGWNQIASIGSFLSAFSTLLFFYVVADAFSHQFVSFKNNLWKFYVNTQTQKIPQFLATTKNFGYAMLFSNSIVNFDVAEPWQMNFQEPATPTMERIIDLHHDIQVILIVIVIFVLYMLIRIIQLFSWK